MKAFEKFHTAVVTASVRLAPASRASAKPSGVEIKSTERRFVAVLAKSSINEW